MNKGTLYIVATPIGNLDDITFRAINILKTVDLIIAEDTRTSQKLLKHYDIKNSLSSYHKFNEISKSDSLIEKLKNGLNIALISDAGTPGISDPGNIIISECIKNNIDVIPIPGACAFVQALIVSGFDTASFSFYGFLSTNNKERKKQLENIKNNNTNISIIYEAPHKLLNTLNDLYNILGNVTISISREITKLHETHIRDNIQNCINIFSNQEIKGEFVICIENNINKINVYSLDDVNTQNIIIEKYKKLSQNMSMKDIAKQLALELDISKNDIYKFLINNK